MHRHMPKVLSVFTFTFCIVNWGYLLCHSKGAGVNDGRVGIGHGTHHSDSSSQGSSCARGEVLFIGGARLPQMHMDINQTFKHTRKNRINLNVIFVLTTQLHLKGCGHTHQVNGWVSARSCCLYESLHEEPDQFASAPAKPTYITILQFLEVQ